MTHSFSLKTTANVLEILRFDSLSNVPGVDLMHFYENISYHSLERSTTVVINNITYHNNNLED